ncbi:MAG: hypothetical protein LBH04_06540 [Tannerellaceae bacterium]|jgi:hypothetical protein|nr:hypothetical protein [Tannerellaceae bacterium]
MAHTNNLPTRESDFYKWQKALITYSLNNAARWGIPLPEDGNNTPGGVGGGGIGHDAEINSETKSTSSDAGNTPSENPLKLVLEARDIYEEKYAAANNPDTKTPGVITAKNVALNNYKSELRKFLSAHITYNPLVTDEDRKNMELPIHKKTHTTIERYSEPPTMDLGVRRAGRVVIAYHDASSTSRAKPYGVFGALIAYSLSDIDHPLLRDELHEKVISTRTPYVLEFSDEERGKMLYVSICWQNTNGKLSPWSDVMRILIP